MTLTQFPSDFTAQLERAVWARKGEAIRGGQEIRFCCPAHEDEHPSARYSPSSLIWHCDVCQKGGGAIDLADRVDVARPRSESRTAASNALTRVDASPVVATYTYRNIQGEVVRQVLRRANKTFTQRIPDGDGWSYKTAGAPNPLYMLTNIAVAIESGLPVVGAEGERDADRLLGLGLCGTTSAMGAGKFSTEHAESLRGAHVWWFIDKDEPGRKHGQDVAEKCAGKVASFKILTPPAPHKDVTDWIEAGATREDIERLADETPEWKRDSATIDRTRAMSGPDFLALEIPEQRWLITGHLPEQAIGWIVGLPKVFKSFYAMELAFAVASGSAFLGRFDAGAPLKERRVLLVQFESSMPSFQARVRSMATRYGIVPPTIYFLSNVPVILEDEASRERIERELEQVKPELLILDPLAAMTTGDENSATEMGVVVRTLRGWRDTYGCAIVTVHHANKTKQEGNGRAGLKMRGSTALYGSSEATISIERPDDDEPRVHVRVEVKDGESPRPYICEFNPVGSDLRVTSETIHHMVADDQIIAAVAASKGEGIDQGTLAEALEISERTVRDRVRRLVGKQIWVKPGTGRGRTPIVYVSKPA